MRSRLTRAEQNERNRALLLAAARQVFLARGYHAATLEQIAEEAGFSKGVVYSQFESKADMFMALLEQRIEERADENARVVEGASGADGLALLRDHAVRRNEADFDWGLLLIEFRVHAARHPELNRRYAAAHARTVQALESVIAAVYERADEAPPLPPRQMAQFILTVSVGARLERAADPDAPRDSAAFEVLTRITGPRAPSRDGVGQARRLAWPRSPTPA